MVLRAKEADACEPANAKLPRVAPNCAVWRRIAPVATRVRVSALSALRDGPLPAAALSPSVRFPEVVRYRSSSLQDVGRSLSESLVHSVAFNAPSQTLVVVLRPRSEERALDQHVLIRRVPDTEYHEVAFEDELVSIGEILVSASKPAAYLNTARFEDTSRRAFSDYGLHRMDLPFGALRRLPPAVDPARPDVELSVSRLVGIGEGDQQLFVVVGCATPYPDNRGARIVYCVSSYDPATGYIQPLFEVPSTFA